MNSKKLISLFALVLTGCCFYAEDAKNVYMAISPDGKNEICLWTDPLAYEVRRSGEVIVARSEIGMKVEGKCLVRSAECIAQRETKSGFVETLAYKKDRIDLALNETFVDFGDWGVRLAARDDGVAYRFETKMPGRIKVNCEKAEVNVPDTSARACVYMTDKFGCEESVPTVGRIEDVLCAGEGNGMIYLPFSYSLPDNTTVAVTDVDVRDYPVWYLRRMTGGGGGVRLKSDFAGWPMKTHRAGGRDIDRAISSGGRWIVVDEHADYLVETEGVRSFPWRAFILGDAPKSLCESDLVQALAASQADYDFSWVKPGKVAWDWWNCFDNQGDKGCNTKTYERFIDFAARTGIEYVIFDEGWSETLNIWKFHQDVDVPYLIDYANKKNVGIILWMAWAQIAGEEERVASHFAKLGAKGFKVDFMDRGDAESERFLWEFADACARNRMIVDYHGVHRPTGMSRAHPNVLNYEGVHGLEQMKFYEGQDILANDVAICFTRMSAGPMDYTPGAMDNYPVGKYPSLEEKDVYTNPGSLGTRCRQMAMMVLYEAPLQMLCDSVKKYRANAECFKFMAKTPVVWDDTVGLGGTPWTYAVIARKAKDGSWYAAAITDKEGRDIVIDTSFLGEGKWTVEIFRDAPDADVSPTNYIHETGMPIIAGSKIKCHLAPGGGFVCRFSTRQE